MAEQVWTLTKSPFTFAAPGSRKSPPHARTEGGRSALDHSALPCGFREVIKRKVYSPSRNTPVDRSFAGGAVVAMPGPAARAARRERCRMLDRTTTRAACQGKMHQFCYLHQHSSTYRAFLPYRVLSPLSKFFTGEILGGGFRSWRGGGRRGEGGGRGACHSLAAQGGGGMGPTLMGTGQEFPEVRSMT
jgi:hypothetical protein